MKKYQITTQAPTRIDLAGGTLDIWPLYLMVQEPSTINLAIDILTTAHWEATYDPQSPMSWEGRLVAEEHQTEITIDSTSWDRGLDTVPQNLWMHFLFARHFFQSGNTRSGKLQFSLRTSSKSPTGAGLGASSSLAICIASAFLEGLKKMDCWSGPAQHSSEDLIKLASDIEASVIKVPTGLQDYYAAVFGGLQQIFWRPLIHPKKHWDFHTTEKIAENILLFYSDHSRNSGLNNWEVFKSMIERHEPTPQALQNISLASEMFAKGLEFENPDLILEALQYDRKNRNNLCSNIETSLIHKALNVGLERNIHGKICGAGGGGCFFLYSPDWKEEERQSVIKTIEAFGPHHMPFKANTKGLQIV